MVGLGAPPIGRAFLLPWERFPIGACAPFIGDVE